MQRLLALVFLSIFVAQPALAGPRVAVVQSDDLGPYLDPVPALLEALGEPAKVINLHGRAPEAEAAVARLRNDPPKVVVALGAKAAFAVKRGLPGVPLVYVSVINPDRYGITGPQITGVAMTIDASSYLSQFVGFFPEVKTIGVLRGPTITAAELDDLRAAADAVGVKLVVREAERPRQVRGAFNDMSDQIDALWLKPDREMLSRESFRALTEDTHRARIPLLVETDNMVRAGGLFAVVPDSAGLGRQAAELAKRIVDGEAPSDLPVESPQEVKVVLNLRTVKATNIPFEELLLDFVDVVIE